MARLPAQRKLAVRVLCRSRARRARTDAVAVVLESIRERRRRERFTRPEGAPFLVQIFSASGALRAPEPKKGGLPAFFLDLAADLDRDGEDVVDDAVDGAQEQVEHADEADDAAERLEFTG